MCTAQNGWLARFLSYCACSIVPACACVCCTRAHRDAAARPTTPRSATTWLGCAQHWQPSANTARTVSHALSNTAVATNAMHHDTHAYTKEDALADGSEQGRAHAVCHPQQR